MEKKKQLITLPNVDYVTVLIIVFFLLVTAGVFVYFKQRISAIESEIKQTSYYQIKSAQKPTTAPVAVNSFKLKNPENSFC